MILLKVICKTMLSITKWAVIILFLFALLIGLGVILSDNDMANILKMGFRVIFVLIMSALAGLLIIMEIKDNYEMYLRKSTQTENTYSIDYKIISEGHRIIKGKTKQLAIQNLNNTLEDNDCTYKITKIKEII